MQSLIVALLLTFPVLAQARLFESLDRVTQRYGEPTKVEDVDSRRSTAQYSYNEYEIVVTFLDGQSQRELFVKRVDSAFTEYEMDAIRKANSIGRTWVLMTERSSFQIAEVWSLGQRFAYCLHHVSPHGVHLVTQAMLDYEKAVEKSKARSNTEGL